MKILTLSAGGINWTWYIVGTLSEGKFKVLAYDRLHNARDTHPSIDGLGDIVESNDSERRAISIRIGDELFPVVNPFPVFSYPTLKD